MYKVRREAWGLLGFVLLATGVTVALQHMQPANSSLIFYYIRPGLWMGIAGLAWWFARGRHDRLRNKSEKMFLIACILAIWFVIYFLSGLYFTYTHNTLVTSAKSVAMNIVAFGVVALCMEWVRYCCMLLARRRNIQWFGSIVVIVFAFAQMNLTSLFFADTVGEYVKIVVADSIPAIAASLLLTYMAVTLGFGSMLIYRLGVVAAIILPPVIPKHDWYMIGVSAVLLAAAIYISIEQTQREHEHGRRQYAQVKRAYDFMILSTLVAMVLFMVGIFSYRPMAIVSNSMLPVFSRGSVVIVQQTSSTMDIKLGDIIQYESSGKMITHRVVAIDVAADGSGKRVFITKGDNVGSRDPLVAESQLRGVVRSQVPYLGYPAIWLREASQGKV